jgi:20S proteasome subunit alpha 2
MPTREIVKFAAAVMQQYTQRGGVRPFGVSLLIIGWEETPTLWQIDPSGMFWAWKATALGKRSDGSRTFLERRFNEELTIQDAIQIAISTLKEGFDGQISADLIEVAVVDENRKFRVLSTTEIKEFLTEP